MPGRPQVIASDGGPTERHACHDDGSHYPHRKLLDGLQESGKAPFSAGQEGRPVHCHSRSAGDVGGQDMSLLRYVNPVGGAVAGSALHFVCSWSDALLDA